MPDQAHDFLKDYQAFAQQSWDTWMRYLQQQPGNPFLWWQCLQRPRKDDLLTRSLASLQAYGTWLQQAAGAGLGPDDGQLAAAYGHAAISGRVQSAVCANGGGYR
jgi:hypothetical protein